MAIAPWSIAPRQARFSKRSSASRLNFKSVLTTHWHPDHSGGNADIVSKVPGLRVFGASAENGRIPALTNPVADGDKFNIGSLEARVIGIPAHTNGHVAYYFPQLKSVFTGDTLFVAGCGRVFEGKAATMVESLGKLASLPDDTKVYCGHEYTEKNLRFALTLEAEQSAPQGQARMVEEGHLGRRLHRPLDHRGREAHRSVSPH